MQALLSTPPEDRRSLRSWNLRVLAYHLALDAGLRRNEIKTLRVGRVRLNQVSLRIELDPCHTKSRHEESVPLTPELLARLREHCRGSGPDEFVVSADGDSPQMSDRAAMRRDFERVSFPEFDELGRRLDFHSLRHTLGTRLARRGANVRQIMEMMRHSSIEMAARYTHTSPLEMSELLTSLAAGSEGSETVYKKRATSVSDCDTFCRFCSERGWKDRL